MCHDREKTILVDNMKNSDSSRRRIHCSELSGNGSISFLREIRGFMNPTGLLSSRMHNLYPQIHARRSLQSYLVAHSYLLSQPTMFLKDILDLARRKRDVP